MEYFDITEKHINSHMDELNIESLAELTNETVECESLEEMGFDLFGAFGY